MIAAFAARAPDADIDTEANVAFWALPEHTPMPSTPAGLGAAAVAILLVTAQQYNVSRERPPRAVGKGTLELLIRSNVALQAVCTVPEYRGQGAAHALVAALKVCTRAGRSFLTQKPGCMVGTALQFVRRQGPKPRSTLAL